MQASMSFYLWRTRLLLPHPGWDGRNCESSWGRDTQAKIVVNRCCWNGRQLFASAVLPAAAILANSMGSLHCSLSHAALTALAVCTCTMRAGDAAAAAGSEQCTHSQQIRPTHR